MNNTTALPPLQPLNAATNNAFQHPTPNASALIDSSTLFNTHSQGTADSSIGDAEKQKSTKLPSTWNDVGSLGMDLANFTLADKDQKKVAMSMNAMKLSQQSTTSSSTKSSPSPIVSPMGSSGKGFPPSVAAPVLQPQSGGSSSSFDLL